MVSKPRKTGHEDEMTRGGLVFRAAPNRVCSGSMTHGARGSEMALMDDGLKYGTITRVLHWLMAGLLVWQIGTMWLRSVLGETPMTDLWRDWHKPVGVLILLVVTIRALWGLYNLKHRPPHQPGLIGKFAVMGHLALYGLTFAIPIIALIRQYGSGRKWEMFGFTLMEGGHPPVKWMVDLGKNFHGELAWVLTALVALHIVMALVHHFVWKDDTLKRIAG